MSTISDYELSRKYFFYHKDGLLDIFIGLGLLLAGATWWAEMVWMAGSWIAIFLPIWITARKSITYRRGTDVEQLAKGNFRFTLVLISMIGFLLLGLLVTFGFFLGFEQVPTYRIFLDTYLNLLIGAGISIILLISAASMHLPRFFAYVALTLAIFVGTWLLDWPFWIPLIVSGGLITLVGLMTLIRFLNEHPPVTKGV